MADPPWNIAAGDELVCYFLVERHMSLSPSACPHNAGAQLVFDQTTYETKRAAALGVELIDAANQLVMDIREQFGLAGVTGRVEKSD